MNKNHILCPVDFSDGTEKTVQTAITLAQSFDAKLTLLTVVESIPVSVYMYIDVNNIQMEMEKEASHKMAKLSEKYKLSDEQTMIITGYSKEAILRVAKEFAVDLILMGSHGHYGVAHHLLGSTSRIIANEANCDVYIVRC